METTISFMSQGWGFALNPLWYQMLRCILYDIVVSLPFLFFVVWGGGGGFKAFGFGVVD